MWLLPACSIVNAAMANRCDEHGLPFAIGVGAGKKLQRKFGERHYSRAKNLNENHGTPWRWGERVERETTCF